MNNQKKIIPVFIALFFALMFVNTIQAQQTTTVTGKVTDAYTSAPLAGVTVQVKGENVTVQTEKDGTYSIDVPKGGKTLILSAGSYQALQVDIEDRQVINVVMTQDVANDPSLW
jgi:TonB-dependent starch-binding outer membrane protein SusC